MIMHQGGAKPQPRGTLARYYPWNEFNRLVGEDRVQLFKSTMGPYGTPVPMVSYTGEEIKKLKIQRINHDMTLEREYYENDARMYSDCIFGQRSTMYTLSVSGLFVAQMLGLEYLWITIWRHAPFTAEELKALKKFLIVPQRICDNLFMLSGAYDKVIDWLMYQGYSWSVNTDTMQFRNSLYYKKLPLGCKPVPWDYIDYIGELLHRQSELSFNR